MKMKWGALVVDGRGKIGGHVASKNRSGSFLRTKVTPTNARTSFQIAARARLSEFSVGWGSLSPAQIAAWNNATEEWSGTNVFGDNVKPTGKNLYTRLNAVLGSIGQSPISSPPSPVAIDEPTGFSADLDIGGGPTELNFDTVDPDLSYQLWATAPHSPGRSFVEGRYRQIAAIPGASVDGYDYESDYIARFGTPEVGKVVSLMVVPVVTSSGQKGLGAKTRATVVST